MKLLAISGFIPEEICDIVRFSQYSGDRNISHYCGYASDFISQALHDKTFDGFVFPKSCDSTRIIGSYLEETGKFIHQINVPSRREEWSTDFFALEIKRYKGAIEKFFSISLSDTIEQRINLINRRNVNLRHRYNNLEQLSYSEYLTSIHRLLQLPLEKQSIPEFMGKSIAGKRVFLIGSFLSNIKILNIIESAGLQVVGDLLPESGRLVSKTEIPLNTGDIYTAIAKSILSQKLSPTQNDYNEILQSVHEEIKSKVVSGIIFITQQYCEAYDYLYYVIKNAFNEIPCIKVALNGTDDDGKTSIMLEAFADTL